MPARAATFELAAPPVLEEPQSRTLYERLTELLSRKTGHDFRYVHSSNWFAYQSDVRRGVFDLYLDEAHFASWRLRFLGHEPLAKIHQRVRFVVLATRSGRIYSKEDLVARTLCAAQQPALGTISVLRKFDGPFRVPRVVETRTPLERVQRLLEGGCAGAVIARHQFTGRAEIRAVAGQLKIVTQTDAYPGLTLTVGPDMPEALRTAVRRILLSPAGERATRELRHRLADDGDFVEATSEEYEGLDTLLRDFPGFSKQ